MPSPPRRLLPLFALACLAFPASASAVTRTGLVERAHAHERDGGTREFWALSTRTSLTPLSVARPARFQGHRVRVTGQERSGRLVAARGGVRDLGRPIARAAANDRDVAIILLHFSNEIDSSTGQPRPAENKATVAASVAGPTTPPGYSVSDYFATQTWGALRLHPQVFGSFDLHDVPGPGCNLGLIANQAINAAEAGDPSFNADDYEHFVFMSVYTPQCSFAGVGAQPGSSVWVNGWINLTIEHELGHNFSSPHAALLRCLDGGGQPVPYSGNCSLVSSEYGDPFDPMGGGYSGWSPGGNASTSYEMEPFRKLGMGGLTVADLPVIAYSGTYNLAPSEAPSGARTLRLPSGDGEFFDLTIRRGGISPFDPFDNATDPVANGVSIRLDAARLGDQPSRLLDFAPATPTFSDAALPVGGSFTVPRTGATATVQSVSQAGAVVRVTGLPDPPPPPAPGGAADVAPALSAYTLSPTRFSAAARGASVAKATGTRVTYKLSEPASVRFTVQRPQAGRKAGRRCVAPTNRNRRARRCTRLVAAGSFAHTGKAGANSFRFTGRVTRRRGLALGAYQLAAVATDATRKRSKQATRAFRIVR
jgi:hypothetical protein